MTKRWNGHATTYLLLSEPCHHMNPSNITSKLTTVIGMASSPLVTPLTSDLQFFHVGAFYIILHYMYLVSHQVLLMTISSVRLRHQKKLPREITHGQCIMLCPSFCYLPNPTACWYNCNKSLQPNHIQYLRDLMRLDSSWNFHTTEEWTMVYRNSTKFSRNTDIPLNSVWSFDA